MITFRKTGWMVFLVPLFVLCSCNRPDALAHFKAAQFDYKAGDFGGAVAGYSEDVRIRPNFVVAYNNRALAKDQLNDIAGAIADFDRALTLDPRYEFAWYNRGNEEVRLKDLDNAVKDYNRAVMLNPNDFQCWENGGMRNLIFKITGRLW